jgi:hypothetical protein
MNHRFNCIATGIGSLPVVDPGEAAALSLKYVMEAPFWPQLPQRDFREQMDAQYSETLPGLVVNEAKKRVFFDTSRDLTPALELFFERYLAKDYGFFKMTEDYAAGFPAFIDAMKKGFPRGMRFVKGHITGPLTAGTSFKDETGRDIIHHEMLFDAVVNEPAMESLGSAFSAVSPEVVAEKLNEIIDTIHELDGIAGIHCCGNADWPMIFNTRVDIVNFDAFGYMERVMLYPGDIKRFIDRGGALAWGIVPTGAYTGNETADLLITRLHKGMMQLEKEGLDRRTILRQCLITPSCGLGSLTPGIAEAILKLLREVSDKMQILIAK